MYEHGHIGRPLLSHQYTDTGEVIDGIPQVIPVDGWYWVQIGHGSQVVWTMGCLTGEYVLMLDAVWHWEDLEFHQRHRLGPPVEYPKADNSPEAIVVTALDFNLQTSTAPISLLQELQELQEQPTPTEVP